MAAPYYVLRWLDTDGNPRDVAVSAGADGLYRLAVDDKGSAEPVAVSAEAVAIGATEELYNATAIADSYVLGVSVTGDTDATFRLYCNSMQVGFKKININVQDAVLAPVKPVFVAAGADVVLTVTNTGVAESDFEAVLYFLQ